MLYYHYDRETSLISPILSTEDAIKKLIGWYESYAKGGCNCSLEPVELYIPDNVTGTLKAKACRKCGRIYYDADMPENKVKSLIEKYSSTARSIYDALAKNKGWYKAAGAHSQLPGILKNLIAQVRKVDSLTKLPSTTDIITVLTGAIDYFEDDETDFFADSHYREVLISVNAQLLKLKKGLENAD